MEYEEIRLLKQSEKSEVHLVREKEGSRLFVRKKLTGRHPVYQMLKETSHPCLPKIYDVIVSEDSTTVIEEYIEGQAAGAEDLSKKQFLRAVWELCSVLELLHRKGIIHRDIKPSNILIATDGHLSLIDFDAARLYRKEAEQDTRLLGTRGFAPPEQYGFAQTDERADIYALGVTLERLLGGKKKTCYRKIIMKCTSLDPDKRYQSVKQVRRAFFFARWIPWGALLSVVAVLGAAGLCVWQATGNPQGFEGDGTPAVLPAPENPHWMGETGVVEWNNVPEAGEGDEVRFYLRLYRKDSAAAPNVDDDDWCHEEVVRFGGGGKNREVISWSVVPKLQGNGIYYFTVSAAGDGIRYGDSPFVVSDAFEFTGEAAEPLPVPTGLEWRLYENDDRRYYYATWSNLEDYDELDSFNVTVYDQDGSYVMNNTWNKTAIEKEGCGGIPIRAEFLVSGPGNAYRFTVQVYSSRPNAYSSSPMPDPVPENYFSPWLYYGPVVQ